MPGIYQPKALDEKVNVEDDAAYEMARRLAREEGAPGRHERRGRGGRGLRARPRARVRRGGGHLAGRRRAVSEHHALRGAEREPESVPQALTFLNTLTRRYQPFEPLAAGREVTMYSCGPTVHVRPHLGLLRRMLVADLVRRTLEFAGYQVKHVVSITDLDDNTIQAAEQSDQSLRRALRPARSRVPRGPRSARQLGRPRCTPGPRRRWTR